MTAIPQSAVSNRLAEMGAVVMDLRNVGGVLVARPETYVRAACRSGLNFGRHGIRVAFASRTTG